MRIFNESPSFSFFQRPFVLIFSFFAAGLAGTFLFDLRDGSSFIVLSLELIVLIFLWFFRRSKKLFLPIMLLAFVFAGCLLLMDREGVFERSSWEKTYQSNDVATVKVKGTNEGNSEWKKLTGIVINLSNKNREAKMSQPVVLYVKSGETQIKEGDVLLVAAPFEKISNAGNPGEFDAAYFWRSKGIRHMAFVGEGQFSLLYQEEQSWVAKSLHATRNALQQMLKDQMSGDELAIALALILGDKSLLDTEVKNSFTNTGAMHVLAVSGLHVGIIMQILLFLFGYFPRVFSKKSSILIVVTLMWIYAIITGLSPSVLRAVFMFSVLVISQLTERNYDAMNTLFFTGFALCLIDPYTFFDIGFQLSFLAMMGIFLLYKPIEQLLYFENWALRKVWQGTAIGFAAQLMTTPLSLYYFHQFPNYFVLTNIGLMASSGIILGGGLFLFGFGWLQPLGKLTGWILIASVFLSLGFIRWVEALPGAVAYGFDFGLPTVLICGLWVLIIFLIKLNARVKMLFYFLGLIIVASMVYTRFEHLKLREICVLNMKFPVFLVKSGKEIFCFHEAQRDEREKLDFAIQAYQKVYPGEVSYFSLKRNWKLQGEGKECIKVSSTKDGKELEVNGKKFFLLTQNVEVKSSKNAVILGMPWVKTFVNHSLKEGAFRYLLNE
jgi:competence protein ComEC